MAYSTGSDNTLEMLDRIDKKLNDLSQSQFITQVLVAGVGAGGAIAGAFLTSYFPIHSQKKKAKEEKEIADKYKRDIISTINNELKSFGDFLSYLLKESIPFQSILKDKDMEQLSDQHLRMLKGYSIVKEDKYEEIDHMYISKFGTGEQLLFSPPTKYKELSQDTKQIIFGDIFLKIDAAYQGINAGIDYGQWINYHGVFSQLRAVKLLETIKIALKSLEEHK